MQITIERLRTLVLAAGIVLVAALVVFLGIARFHNRLNTRELPKRLGIDITQEVAALQAEAQEPPGGITP